MTDQPARGVLCFTRAKLTLSRPPPPRYHTHPASLAGRTAGRHTAPPTTPTPAPTRPGRWRRPSTTSPPPPGGSESAIGSPTPGGPLCAAAFLITEEEFNVHDLLDAGRINGDLTECPESGSEDNDDYIITIAGGRGTAIECGIMGEDHFFQL